MSFDEADCWIAQWVAQELPYEQLNVFVRDENLFEFKSPSVYIAKAENPVTYMVCSGDSIASSDSSCARYEISK